MIFGLSFFLQQFRELYFLFCEKSNETKKNNNNNNITKKALHKIFGNNKKHKKTIKKQYKD